MLSELKRELDEERANPTVSSLYRLEARAGIDPGEASDAWHHDVVRLSGEVGPSAVEDVLAALAGSTDGLDRAKRDVQAIRGSDLTVDLDRTSGTRRWTEETSCPGSRVSTWRTASAEVWV